MSFIRDALGTLPVEALSLILKHEAPSEGGRVTMCQSRLLCPLITFEQKRCPQRSLPDAFRHRWSLQNVACRPLRCERVGECVTLQSCCSLSCHISAHNVCPFFKMEYISTSDDQATLPPRGFQICMCVSLHVLNTAYQNTHTTIKERIFQKRGQFVWSPQPQRTVWGFSNMCWVWG